MMGLEEIAGKLLTRKQREELDGLAQSNRRYTTALIDLADALDAEVQDVIDTLSPAVEVYSHLASKIASPFGLKLRASTLLPSGDICSYEPDAGERSLAAGKRWLELLEAKPTGAIQAMFQRYTIQIVALDLSRTREALADAGDDPFAAKVLEVAKQSAFYRAGLIAQLAQGTLRKDVSTLTHSGIPKGTSEEAEHKVRHAAQTLGMLVPADPHGRWGDKDIQAWVDRANSAQSLALEKAATKPVTPRPSHARPEPYQYLSPALPRTPHDELEHLIAQTIQLELAKVALIAPKAQPAPEAPQAKATPTPEPAPEMQDRRTYTDGELREIYAQQQALGGNILSYEIWKLQFLEAQKNAGRKVS